MVSTVRTCAAPQDFCGDIGNYCYTSLHCTTDNCTTLLFTRSYMYKTQLVLFNQAMPYSLSKVGKPGMVLRTNN